MCMRKNSQDTWVTLHPLPTSTLSEVKARLGHEKKIYALNKDFTTRIRIITLASDLKNWYKVTLDP